MRSLIYSAVLIRSHSHDVMPLHMATPHSWSSWAAHKSNVTLVNSLAEQRVSCSLSFGLVVTASLLHCGSDEGIVPSSSARGLFINRSDAV